jgi:ribulose-5-phosphate 4-epimerase/fuculose-1-phosphate aldolase
VTDLYKKELDIFIRMSLEIGSHPEYVQGGGGNTSYKLDEKLMAVKASGFRLDKMTSGQGFVILDYGKIAAYYNGPGVGNVSGSEEESSSLIRGSIVPFEGLMPSRPSVEAGFHSLLEKAVIHSHSVYANILCCCEEGRDIMKEIFGRGSSQAVYIPYADPGFILTVSIKKAVSDMKPSLIFMENHGLIASGENADKCLELHTYANNRIKEYLNIHETYPEIALDKNETGYIGRTGYIKEFTRENRLDRDFLESNVLYPDQIVYLNNNSMDMRPDGIYYASGEGESYTSEETMLAYIYVIDMIKKKGLTLRTMPDAGVRFIKNWESERYRRQIAEKSGR